MDCILSAALLQKIDIVDQRLAAGALRHCGDVVEIDMPIVQTLAGEFLLTVREIVSVTRGDFQTDPDHPVRGYIGQVAEEALGNFLDLRRHGAVTPNRVHLLSDDDGCSLLTLRDVLDIHAAVCLAA
jgi:hypothetical protein